MRRGSRISRSARSSPDGNEFMRFSDVSQLALAKLHAKIATDRAAAIPNDSATRRRTGTPSRSQIAASASPDAMSATAIRTTSRRMRPC